MAHSCCNPFDIPGHAWSTRKKSLRPVTELMCERAPYISIGSKICDTCRKKLSKESPVLTSEPDSPSPVAEELYVQTPAAVASLNKCLAEIGETPYSESKARAKDYSRQKVKKITEAMQRTIITGEVVDDGSEMIQQLKEKFQATTKMNKQLQVLTVLPKSWSVKKIQQEFGVSTYMAQKSKKIVKETGVLSLPDPKPGPSLLPETVYSVHVQVGKRVHVQKRLVLSNLREVYHEFKEKFPDRKIGFSKFAELRPKHCILAGASGTHAVCVCTIHQNVKLMMLEMRLSDLPTYHHCLANIMCNPPLPKCYLGECDACPGIVKFKEELITLLDDNDIDQIIYKQWVSTDRSTLETCCASAEEFVDTFCEKLELLRSHSFIASEQASFYAMCKSNLQPAEIWPLQTFLKITHLFFKMLPRAFTGIIPRQLSTPLLPTILIQESYVRHLSYVIISDCLHHDTVAVYLFQKCFIAFLKSHLPERLHPKKIIYFSDGAASQYKNRQFVLPQK